MINYDKKVKTTQINLYSCEHPVLTDPQYGNLFLEELVEFISMNKIPEEIIGSKNPVTFQFNPGFVEKQEHGVTGIITLYESHCAFHSWPELDGFLCVVISSCKDYDVAATARWIAEKVNAKGYKFKFLDF